MTIHFKWFSAITKKTSIPIIHRTITSVTHKPPVVIGIMKIHFKWFSATSKIHLPKWYTKLLQVLNTKLKTHAKTRFYSLTNCKATFVQWDIGYWPFQLGPSSKHVLKFYEQEQVSTNLPSPTTNIHFKKLQDTLTFCKNKGTIVWKV